MQTRQLQSLRVGLVLSDRASVLQGSRIDTATPRFPPEPRSTRSCFCGLYLAAGSMHTRETITVRPPTRWGTTRGVSVASGTLEAAWTRGSGGVRGTGLRDHVLELSNSKSQSLNLPIPAQAACGVCALPGFEANARRRRRASVPAAIRPRVAIIPQPR